ncbi:MAG: HAMP domain-containing histidine kinase [Oscillospiraceae bacterium]|nr:HAMP domain-containing histidine kinase [Oscillospiraceae bacterium]
MDREQLIKQRRRRYMAVLMAVFAVILVLFDIIVFSFNKDVQYADIDRQFDEAAAAIQADPDGSVENFLTGKNVVYTANGTYIINYKIFLIVRNRTGSILNESYLLNFDQVLAVRFDQRHAGRNHTGMVERNGNRIYLRTHTEEVVTTDGRTYYIQMVADTTDVQTGLLLSRNTLIWSTLVVMALVAVVGWFLSKTLTKGIFEAFEKQDDFISYASHEIRAPLAVIHSSMELLLDKPSDRIMDRSEYIINALTETNRLRKMVSNLLEMAQLQASEMTIKREVFHLDTVVDDLMEPFKLQAELDDKTLNVDTQPSQAIRADKQLITELLAILLENAIKYTLPGDSISITTREMSGTAVITVADTGVGVSDEAMEKIFTRFYREERKSEIEHGGSGLGLYIASLIVARHDGAITVDHNRPKGTVFMVTIPNGIRWN